MEQQNKSTGQNCSSVLVCRLFSTGPKSVDQSMRVVDKLFTLPRNLYNVIMHVIEKPVLPV